MLILSLMVSGILLSVAIASAFLAKRPLALFVPVASALALVPIGIGLLLPVVVLHALLLGIALACWQKWRRHPGTFLPLSAAATLLAYGVVGWFAFQEFWSLRNEFPYVSLEDRLPARTDSTLSRPLPASAEKQLAEIEDRVEDGGISGVDPFRREALKRLHDDAVTYFANQPGFGATRMVRGYPRVLEDVPPLTQPASRYVPGGLLGSEQAGQKPAEAPLDNDLSQMHFDSVVDFVNARGFGYFKDPCHVAGFQEHRFSKVPQARNPWTLQTLDLVGLVVHDEPLAYISENLPRMEELRKAPTRKLDGFEDAGLKALRQGEDLFVRSSAEYMRVLGAIRSARQCLECHGGQRGDLLGAFSYTFARAGK